MKLLFCPKCWDVFKLKIGEIRMCECGSVKGKYTDDGRFARVNDKGISIAIGNGSLLEAIEGMQSLKDETNDTADRRSYQLAGNIKYAWVRPNFGPGNPHCLDIDER